MKKLVLRNDKAGNLFELTGIPDEVWKVFEDQAKKLFPDEKNEEGETAVAKVLASFITSVVDGESRTLLLTGIPAAPYNSFEGANTEAGITTYRLIAEMMTAANEGRYIITAPRDLNDLKNQRILVFMGFPSFIWQKWQEIADQMAAMIPGEYPVISQMLEFLLQFPKVAKITKNPNVAPAESGVFQWNVQK